MKKIYSLITILLASVAGNAQVVISQVYGGGGNTGAVFSHDFVELFNKGTQSVTLTGHSLQYASATGAFSANNTQTLPAITIPAGGYFLIEQGAGSNTTITALPTPDLVPTVANNGVVLAIGGTNGKIALVSDTTPITSPTDNTVIDFVGFGSATTFEGTGPTAALGNALAAIRNNNGCNDTNDNTADFTVATPTPRNSASPVNTCAASVKENDIEGLNIYPNPAVDNVTITSYSTELKSIQLFDLAGKKVLSVETENTFNVSGLNKGLYIMKITEAGKTATRKLIVK